MYKNLLPIGSVVTLKKIEGNLMILGRIQCKEGENKIYDYTACVYPMGLVNPKEILFFEQEQIQEILYMGFQNEQEHEIQKNIFEQVNGFELKNGKIVSY